MPRFATRLRRASAALVVLGLGLVGALVAAPAANAATITVTSSADAGAGTLRQAVIDANSGAFPGMDTIQFSPAVTSIVLASPIVVTEGINLYGPGVANLQISRNGDFEMFEFDMAATGQNVGIDRIRFDGGLGTTQRGFDFLENNPVQNLTISNSEFQVFQTAVLGGVIRIDELTGNFILVASTFHDNASAANANVPTIYAEDIDAGFISISDTDFTANSGESGAGLEIVFSSAEVTIADCTFTDNQTTNAGAAADFYAIDGLTIRRTTFDNNDVANSVGGSLAVGQVGGQVSIEDSSFSDSDAFSGSAGAAYFDTVDGLEIIDTTFTNNSAATDGGAVWTSVTGDTLIRGSTFTQNTAGDLGGAVFSSNVNSGFEVDASRFDSNSVSGDGGAISFLSLAGVTASIGRSTFIGNVANAGPGGARGAAVQVSEIDSNALLFVSASTFSDNFVDGGVFGFGGGVGIAVGTIHGFGRLGILNSTFFEDEQGAPGTVFVETIETDGDLNIENTTLVADLAVRVGTNSGDAQVVNSIVDGDVNDIGSDSVRLDAGTSVGMTYSALSSPLDATVTDNGGNQFAVADMQLGPLANNGGLTQTMVPAAGSPVVNAGDPAFVAPPAQDQRGGTFVRVFGGRIDIGSLELQTLALAATGLEVSPVMPIAGALALLLGAGLVLIRRRRLA